MKYRFSLKWSLFVFGFTAFSLCLFFVLFAYGFSSKTISISKQENPGLPMRLKIPLINIDAFIEQVGLTPTGAMDVPQGADDVAWFSLGPRPGEPGSSVIDGHYGYKNNRPAVFDNLYKLQKGDKIMVTNQAGIVTTFVVRSVVKYDAKANAGSVFSSSDGLAHLNLITCSGVWDSVAKSHSQRLIVFADKEI